MKRRKPNPGAKTANPADSPRRVGLARALSKLGYCSRSQAAELIRAGRVRLNGAVRNDPETPVREGKDRIAVDGVPVTAGAKLYFMLNKPRGVVTTARDEKDRTTIYAALGAGLPWVAPVGRLDKASEGLLLLTNDSEWSARVLAPETHLPRTYHVQVDAVVEGKLTQRLQKGITDGDDFLQALSASILRSGERNTWLEIVLDEGKNRQIRRMLAHLGVRVKRLVRVALGPLAMGDLPKGAFRPLTAQEKIAVDQAIAAEKRGRLK